MKFKIGRFLFLMGLFLIPNLVFCETMNITKDGRMFHYDEFLGTMKDQIDGMVIYFQSIAFLIFMYSFAMNMKTAKCQSDIIKIVSKTCISVTLLVLGPYLINIGMEVADALTEKLGTQQSQIIAKVNNIAEAFSVVDFSIDANEPLKKEGEADETEEPVVDGFEEEMAKTGFWGKLKQSMNDTFSRPRGFWGHPIAYCYLMFKKFLYIMMLGIVGLVLKIASYLMIIMETIRFYSLQLSLLLYPICLASLSLKVFSSQAVNYLFNILGQTLWPLGWGLGNILTVAGIDSVLKYTGEKLGMVKIEQLSSLDTQAAPYVLSNEFINKILHLGFMETLVILFFFLMLGLWSIIVTFYGPKLIKLFLKSGGDFYDSMMDGTAQVAGKVTGAAVSLGGAAVGGVVGGIAGAAIAKGGSMVGSGGIGSSVSNLFSNFGGGSQSSGSNGGAASGVTGSLLKKGMSSGWDKSKSTNFDVTKYMNEYKKNK